MPRETLQHYSLYLVSFASSFGFITVVTLLPTYIDLLDPSGALVSELAPDEERANVIGTYKGWRMAASTLGTLGAGAVFGLLAGLLALSFVGVGRFVRPDETSAEGFAFTGLALNRRIATITGFRAQYAVSVTLVRNWIPIHVGVSAARGGLAAGAVAVGIVWPPRRSRT